MADITNISALLSPLPVSGVQSSGITGNAAGRLASVLTNILPGTIISGFVLNRDATGNPILRTDQGDMLIETDLFLKIGSDVTARIEKHGNKTQANILTVDNLPPAQAQARQHVDQPDIIGRDPTVAAKTAAGTAAPNTNAQAASTQAATISAPPPAARQTLEAIVIGPSTAANANAKDALPAGTVLNVRIISAEPAHANQPPPIPAQPQAQAQPEAAANKSSASPAAQQSTPPPVVNQPEAEAAPQQAKLPVPPAASYAAYGKPTIIPTPHTPATPAATATPQAAIPADTPETAATAPTATPARAVPAQTNAPNVPQQIQATVIASEPDGTLIAQSPVGLLKLPILSKLSAGGTLQLAVVSSFVPPNAAAANGVLPGALPPGLQLAQQWPALQEVIDVMLQESFSGKEALEALQARIPWIAMGNSQSSAGGSASNNFASPLLFFMNAMMGGGNIRSWLGAHTTHLLEENGHTPLLDQADSEFSQLSNLARTPSAQGWQSLFFPVMTGEQLQMARLFVRRDRKNNENSNSPGADDTRFVVEVALSQLGEMQLDGFVRKAPAKPPVFDLIIRSQSQLPSEMQQEIIGIYDSAGELTGFRGTLLFQQVVSLPPSPMQELFAPQQDETPDILA